MGNLLAAVVHTAGLQDRDGAYLVTDDIKRLYPRLHKLWADGGYRGDFAGWMRETYGIEVEITTRSKQTSGFTVIPRRWIVERTFAWLGRTRRLSKDYEFQTAYSESWMYIASLSLMRNRLSPREVILKPHRLRHNRRYRDLVPEM